MNKTTEALKLAEALENDAKEHREVSYGLDCPPERTANWKHALNCEAAARLIREALAEQSKCACDSPAWCTKYKKCNREVLGLPKAQPVKQEPVMDYEYICALREGEQHQAEDSYFFVRPENDTPTSRKMFCQGFERGFHKGLKYAAPVSAKREWVYLTDDEIDELIRKWYSPDMGLLEFAWAVIVAFEDKNK